MTTSSATLLNNTRPFSCRLDCMSSQVYLSSSKLCNVSHDLPHFTTTHKRRKACTARSAQCALLRCPSGHNTPLSTRNVGTLFVTKVNTRCQRSNRPLSNVVCRSSSSSGWPVTVQLSHPSDENLEAWEQPQAWNHFTTGEVAQGVATLVMLERLVALLLEKAAVAFPAPVIVLAAIAAAMAINTPSSRELFAFHEGAVAFFDAWMPMFFVPSVAGIALAPAPAGNDLMKAVIILGGSYLFNLWATAKLTGVVQRLVDLFRGKESSKLPPMSHEERLKRIRTAGKAWSKTVAVGISGALRSIADQSGEADVKQAAGVAASLLGDVAARIQMPKRLAAPPSILCEASLVAGAVLLLPLIVIRSTNALLMTPGLFLITIGFFTAAKRVPAEIRKWLSPTVLAGASIGLIMASYGSSSLLSWRHGIALYKEGAGAILAMLIGPAVASLGFKVHSQRKLLERSTLQLFLVCLLVVPSGLLVTAAIGGVLGASIGVTASLLPATTTLGLAREMVTLLGGNKGLVVAGVTIAGTAGISTAAQLMAYWKVEGALARGMAVGASSHTLGASAIAVSEPQAAAVAGLALALKGTITVIAISYAPFRQLLLNIASSSL
eukprot:TRINITY_DN3023_c0_g1_i1.p1 TRINITY_DN3023_c0_g1~~TRINITY_DN3023_c0_g1_i1.p1  ORF type:complete len:608 (+),score=76.98 TRINITY_DN3023_c0_g1_i1:213-2036(+)